MKNGYEIFWTQEAVNNLKLIFDYLLTNWSKKEISNFTNELENRLGIIFLYPKLFRKSKKKNIHISFLTKQITLYYKIEKRKSSILLFLM
ncbi:MAG: type II toxin-antitoxin system RelE/ParE family toxin [Ignavibacterium sp.]|uniref:type II toxin-antitoxin system RelE/ParE family toxin n=1 Tax=Ignavibacterium sp. TaxID=2651167 RepID=UPI00404A5676